MEDRSSRISRIDGAKRRRYAIVRDRRSGPVGSARPNTRKSTDRLESGSMFRVAEGRRRRSDDWAMIFYTSPVTFINMWRYFNSMFPMNVEIESNDDESDEETPKVTGFCTSTSALPFPDS